MDCPVCSTRLRQVKAGNLDVDVCTNCSGIWFDSGELQVFLRELVKREDITPERTRLFTPREVATIDRSEPDGRVCPKCGLEMKTFNYSYDSNVFVDKCPECEGIWTDRGEVKRLAAYLKTDPRVAAIGAHVAQRKQFLDDLREMGEMGQQMKRNASGAAFMPRIIMPVGDDLEAERFPFATIGLIVVCIAVFVFEMVGVPDLQDFVNRYGFVASDFFSIGLVTSMFLHGDFFHIFGNMLFLWIFGDNVEDRLGYKGYVIFYLAAGVAASVLFAVFHLGSTTPCIGASGAISGVMGAYVTFYPHAKVKMLVYGYIIPIPAGIYLTAWFAMQIGYSVIAFRHGDYGVAWLAHVGGFAFGAAAAWVVKKYSARDKSQAQAA